MKRKYGKPEHIIVGNSIVKIYPHVKSKGRTEPYVCWQVADFTSGERRFRTFADHDSAVREAKRIAGLLSAGDAIAAAMSSNDAASYGRAVELIRPTGDPLELVAARYAEPGFKCSRDCRATLLSLARPVPQPRIPSQNSKR